MRQLRADIDVETPLRQPVHVVRKALPRPGDAGAQHGLRNVLDAFHELDQAEMIVRFARREADAAIAHDRGGDAVLGRGGDVLAPGHLSIIVGVDVDEARRDQLAPGVDLFLALGRNLADLGDAAVLDRDIGLEELAAVAVCNGAAANHEVWRGCHGVRPVLSCVDRIIGHTCRLSTAGVGAQQCIRLAFVCGLGLRRRFSAP